MKSFARLPAAGWPTRGHRVEQAANANEALAHLKRKYLPVAVVDMNMPGMSGMEVLQRMKESGLETEVIILTGQATVADAVQAMKFGAYDYLTKPFPLSELEQRCRLAADHGKLCKENRQLKAILKRSRPKTGIIGTSAVMLEVQRLIGRVAPTDKSRAKAAPEKSSRPRLSRN